ncbi:MAG TPA: UDP-2,3-diacylglucosamine diphosphatase LpxI [Anaerohalosphaeraceae bacterium]|nr:UDP-2,3-diacylglucosamine diphosphatase LpxI [Anaerohalosphaeraceae bacterium]
MSESSQHVLGLIAGQGRLPFLVAQGAKKAGLKVVCAGLTDSVEPELARYVDVFFNAAIARPGGWMRKLRRHGVRDTIMVGRVAKTKIYTPWRLVKYLPDWRALRIWYWRLRKQDKRNDSVLNAIADELASGGIILVDSTQYCKDSMADDGVMTRTRPPASVLADIEFGWPMVMEVGRLDIGQAIAVKEREIIAVEAIEGTAEMIVRAGQLCRKGNWTLLKSAKPKQDMRFDVPCIGPDTIESLAKNKACCVVVEKHKTIIIDKQKTLELADKLGIAVVGH